MTKGQLAIQVLSKLGIYDQDTVSGADQQNVNDGYTAVYSVLSDEGLVAWATTDDIPDRFAVAIVGLVATYLKPNYRVALIPGEELPMALQPMAKLLRRQLAAPYVHETTEAEYF